MTDRPTMTVGQVTSERPRQRAPKAAERIAQEIVRDIVSRSLASGDRLPLESELAAQYEVSRSTLREALRLLETQGLIALKPGPGGGTVVGSIEPAFMSRMLALYFHLGATTYDQLMRTQVVLESNCARLAAASARRQELMQRYHASCDVDDTAAYRQATIGFHSAVYELADNPALTMLAAAVTTMVTQHVLMTMEPVELRPELIEQHQQLAATIAAGDGQAAAELTASHFEFQHDHFRRQRPARVAEAVEWK